MKKSYLIESILFLSVYVDKEQSYKELVKNISLPELTKMIVYDLFLKEFDYKNCNDYLYEAYSVVLKYSTEISNNGYVNFIEE